MTLGEITESLFVSVALSIILGYITVKYTLRGSLKMWQFETSPRPQFLHISLIKE